MRRVRRRRERRRLRPSFSADLLPQRSARSREIRRGRGATPPGRGRARGGGGVRARLTRPSPPCWPRSARTPQFLGRSRPCRAPELAAGQGRPDGGELPPALSAVPQGRCGGGRLRQPFLGRNGGARPREASLQGLDGGARLRELSLHMHHGGAQLRQLPIRGFEGTPGATPLQGSEGHHGRANGICLLRGTEAAVVEPLLSDLSPQTPHGGALRDPSP